MLHANRAKTDHVEGSCQIDGNNLIPESKWKSTIATYRTRCIRDAGTVDDSINGTKFLDSRIDASFNRSFIGDVDLGKKTTIGAHFLDHSSARLGLEIKDNDIATVGKNASRNRLSDSRCTTGDNGGSS